MYVHCGPALKAIRESCTRAKYIYDTTGAPQRLVYGTWE
jgi:hypothetical protein